jgi:hypothetical protein
MNTFHNHITLADNHPTFLRTGFHQSGTLSIVEETFCIWGYVWGTASAKNISVQVKWLRQSGRGPSEPSETPWWRLTPCLASIPRVAVYMALRSPFRRFFSFCRSPIHSGVVATVTIGRNEFIGYTLESGLQWVTLRKPLLTFLLHEARGA